MGLKLSEGLKKPEQEEVVTEEKVTTPAPVKRDKSEIRIYQSPKLMLDENGQVWIGPIIQEDGPKYGRLAGILGSGKVRWDYRDEPPVNPIELATPLLRYVEPGELIETTDFNIHGCAPGKNMQVSHSDSFWLREI